MSVTRIRSRRVLLAALAVLVVGVFAPPAAWAHGANGQPIPDATHYLSTITGISPAIPGISATVSPRGEWLEVSNTTSQTLTVLGYAREPYLKIDQSGVYENSYSPTLSLNKSLFGDLSQLGDSSLPPLWQRISTTRTTRWHDHRIHWMGADRPPAVKATPAAPHLIGTWNVHLMLGSSPVTVAGTLSWLPLKPRISRFVTNFLIADAVVFGIFVAAVGWLLRRRKLRDRSANWEPRIEARGSVRLTEIADPLSTRTRTRTRTPTG